MAATPEDMNDGFINFYKVLGLQDLESDQAKIRQAYLRQAKIHHSDKGGDDEQFKRIKAAYEILSDDNRHNLYKTEFCLRQQPSIFIISSQYGYKSEDLALKVYKHQVNHFNTDVCNPSAGFRCTPPTRDQVFFRGFVMKSLASAKIESSQFHMKSYNDDGFSYFQIFCKEFMLCNKDGLVIGMFCLENNGKVSLTLVNETFDAAVIGEQLDRYYYEATKHKQLPNDVPTWFKSENLQINKEIFMFERLKAQDEVARLRKLTGPISGYGAQEKADMIEAALRKDSKEALMLALEHQRLPIVFKGITAVNNFQSSDENTDANSAAQVSAKSAPTK